MGWETFPVLSTQGWVHKPRTVAATQVFSGWGWMSENWQSSPLLGDAELSEKEASWPASHAVTHWVTSVGDQLRILQGLLAHSPSTPNMTKSKTKAEVIC